MGLKISDLAAETTVAGTDHVVIVKAGVTKKALVSDVFDALPLITNALVDNAAAIAGSKIAPDFGAQLVETSTGVLVGNGGYVGVTGAAQAATAGHWRLPWLVSAKGRNSGDTANLTIFELGSTNRLSIGATDADAEQVTTLALFGSSAINMRNGSTTKMQVVSSGVSIFNTTNLGLNGNSGTFPSVGGGVGVFGIGNANTNPGSNPTNGIVAYSDTGAGKARGSGGTVTTWAPADPHCPRCGRDFALEWVNDTFAEELSVCLPCLLGAVAAAGVNVDDFTIRKDLAA